MKQLLLASILLIFCSSMASFNSDASNRDEQYAQPWQQALFVCDCMELYRSVGVDVGKFWDGRPYRDRLSEKQTKQYSATLVGMQNYINNAWKTKNSYARYRERETGRKMTQVFALRECLSGARAMTADLKILMHSLETGREFYLHKLGDRTGKKRRHHKILQRSERTDSNEYFLHQFRLLIACECLDQTEPQEQTLRRTYVADSASTKMHDFSNSDYLKSRYSDAAAPILKELGTDLAAEAIQRPLPIQQIEHCIKRAFTVKVLDDE